MRVKLITKYENRDYKRRRRSAADKAYAVRERRTRIHSHRGRGGKKGGGPRGGTTKPASPLASRVTGAPGRESFLSCRPVFAWNMVSPENRRMSQALLSRTPAYRNPMSREP